MDTSNSVKTKTVYDGDLYARLMAATTASHNERTAFDYAGARGEEILALFTVDAPAACDAFRAEFYTDKGNEWRARRKAYGL